MTLAHIFILGIFIMMGGFAMASLQSSLIILKQSLMGKHKNNTKQFSTPRAQSRCHMKSAH